MNACGLFVFIALLTFLLLTLRTEGYVVTGSTDTSNGYCEGDYGKIPVGGTGYNDQKCEKIICSPGTYAIEGCGSVSIKDMPDNCKLVGKPGHYPNCCKRFMKCEGDDSGKED